MKIGILTDSTADLSQEIVNKYNIEVVPLSVHFEHDVYKDGVNLSPDEFFEKLKNTDILPKTSQPSTKLLGQKYREMSETYDAILSIHLSAGLSSTYDAARNISRQLTEINIYPYDSASISLGLGFQVLLAAKLAKKLDSVKEIIKILNKAKQKLFLFFTVDDLTYMEKGGRIGKASALLGGIFNINPIISISTSTGRVQPLYKTRGKKRTMKKMVTTAFEKLTDENYAWLGFAHGDRKEDMLAFKSSLLDKINVNKNLKTEIFESRISATLGCHVGPSVYAGVILSGDYLNL